MTQKTLIRGGCVLTMGRTNFLEADVLLEGGHIIEVGSGLRARDAETIDASDTVAMPGFVDTHRHTAESLFRNQGGPAPAISDAYSRFYEPDDVYAGTLVGLLAAVDAGITTVADWCEVAAEPAHLEAALQAHADAGVRSVFVLAKPESDVSWREQLGSLATRQVNPMVTFAAGAESLHRDGFKTMVSDLGDARDLGLRIHAHAGITNSDQGVITEVAAGNHLRGDVTLVHCTNLSETDLAAIASAGAFVAIAPQSEMSTGLGSPPMQKLIDRGIRPGLGIDSERVASGDMFAQMRAAISLQHAVHFDQKLAGKAGVPRLLTTREVIRYATVDGARVAGLGGITGSLEPGRAADLVLLRTDRPNIFPINDPIGAVVWGMDTSNVDWVFAGGRVLKREGELVADSGRARSLAVAARERVGRAGGLLVSAGDVA